MAKPRRDAMIRTLQRLTREFFEDDQHTPLDYALAWTERGKTLVNLSQFVTAQVNGTELGAPLNKPGQFEVTRFMISKYLDEIGGEGTGAKLAAARRAGAHGLVEEGLQALDDSPDERDAVNANERRMQGRERLAAVWNKEFAKQGNATNVFLSFGQMHLDALRQRTASATISPTAEGAIAVDAVIEPTDK